MTARKSINAYLCFRHDLAIRFDAASQRGRVITVYAHEDIFEFVDGLTSYVFDHGIQLVFDLLTAGIEHRLTLAIHEVVHHAFHAYFQLAAVCGSSWTGQRHRDELARPTLNSTPTISFRHLFRNDRDELSIDVLLPCVDEFRVGLKKVRQKLLIDIQLIFQYRQIPDSVACHLHALCDYIMEMSQELLTGGREVLCDLAETAGEDPLPTGSDNLDDGFCKACIPVV